MRTALYLILALTAVAALADGMLSAEEESRRSQRFDVSALVQAFRHQRGAKLGAGAPIEFDDVKAGQPPRPSSFASGEDLVDLVSRNVEPASWSDLEGVDMRARGRWLYVRSTPEIVAKVAEFLYQLTLEMQRRLLLSIEVSEGASAGFPAPPEGTPVSSSGSLALPMGIERALTRTNRVQYVADYEVEIAQGSNISNPILTSADQGLLGTFVATPSIDGERVVIEALVQTAAYGKTRLLPIGVDEEYMPGAYRDEPRTTYGTLELPRYEHVQVHFTTVVPVSGGELTLPVAIRDRMLQLHLKTRMQGQGGHPRVIDLTTLTREPMPVIFGKTVGRNVPQSWFAPRLHFLSDDLPGPCYLNAEEILDEITSTVSPAFWEEKGEVMLLREQRIHVRSDERRLAEVRSFLRELEKDAVRPVVVDLRIWSASGPVASGPTKAFPREGARLVAAGTLPTILGRGASLMAGSTANVIVDYDVEVAQEARIADPIVGQSFDGLVVNLRPTLSQDKRTVDLGLQMLLARRTLSESPFKTGAKFLGPIDDLHQDRIVIDTNLLIPAGSTHVIDLGVDPEAKGRRLAAEIRVTLP